MKHSSRKHRHLNRLLKPMLEEMQSSSHELAGKLMDRCQSIEALMKLHITRNNSTKKLNNLEGKTFGQLLGMFRRYSKDKELNEWLDNLRQLRNDVAHTFFRNTRAWAREYGAGIERLNHKVLRKGLRITEICLGRLRQLE